MRHIIIASTSALHGSGYLDYLLKDLELFFIDAEDILFIPYARPGGISHNDYTEKARLAFSKINKTVKGIHTFKNPLEAIKNAQGIFVGGGNTFVLTNQLYKNNLVGALQTSVNNGTRI